MYDDIRAVKRELTDCSGIDTALREVSSEMEVVAGLIRQCVEDNAAKEQNQAVYMAHYTELAERYEALTSNLAALQNERKKREIKADTLSGFLFEVGEWPELDITFSEQRWWATVDHVTVYPDGTLVFSFKNGSEVTVEM